MPRHQVRWIHVLIQSCLVSQGGRSAAPWSIKHPSHWIKPVGKIDFQLEAFHRLGSRGRRPIYDLSQPWCCSLRGTWASWITCSVHMCGGLLCKHKSPLFAILLSMVNFNELRADSIEKGNKRQGMKLRKAAATKKPERMRAAQQCLAEWWLGRPL